MRGEEGKKAEGEEGGDMEARMKGEKDWRGKERGVG